MARADGRAAALANDADDAADVNDTAHDADTRVEALRTQISQVLDELEQHGLLSDARATDAVVHAKSPRFGTRRLRQALQARALPADLIETALQSTRGTEWARASEVWRRRFGAPPADAREHARQMRFLLARGFEAAVAQGVIRRASDANGDDPQNEGLPED